MEKFFLLTMMISRKETPRESAYEQCLLQYIRHLQINNSRGFPLPRESFDESDFDTYLSLERDRSTRYSKSFWKDFELFAKQKGHAFKRSKIRYHCFSLVSDSLGLGDWYDLGVHLEFLSKLVTGFCIEFISDPAADGAVAVHSNKSEQQWEQLRQWCKKTLPTAV